MRKGTMKKSIMGLLFMLMLCLSFPVYGAAKGNVHALVICGSEDGETGAARMLTCLRQNRIPLYDTTESNIKVFNYNADQDGCGSTIAEFKNQVKNAFKDSTSNDLNILYYTGHTSHSRANQYDSAAMVYSYSEYLQTEDVIDELAQYKGKYVLILDTCYAYSYYKWGVSQLSESDQNRFTLLMAQGYNATAPNNSLTNIGFYSDAILKGLGDKDSFTTLNADTNRDGAVTVGELHEYAEENTSNILQTVFVEGDTDLVLFQFAYTDVKKSSKTLYLDQTTTLSKTVYQTGDRARTVKWKSSNPSVASVNKNGKVTAKKAGTATITAYLADANGKMYRGSQDTCKITVKKPTIKLTPTSKTLKKGSTYKLTATVKGKSKKVTWTSSNTAVATVNQSGKVTAKKVGTATITAKANGKKATCKITVKANTAYAKTGIYQKEYNPSGYSYVEIKPADALVVLKVSGGKIKFVVEHYGLNGSPIYQTNTITASLSGNKTSTFKWSDSWGNSGTGRLTFKNKKVTVKMNTTKEASINRWLWNPSVTLPYTSMKLTAANIEYYSNLSY